MIHLQVNRKKIFMDAYAQLSHKNVAEMLGRLHINFTGEGGQDAGGLTKDFFIELSRAMFDANNSLFSLTSNGVTFHPNKMSHVNSDHLNFFKFIGRVLGKAILDNQLLELHFSKPLYKMIVGDDLEFEDLKDLDNIHHSSLVWYMA
jgi:E3 ubiquitin-protein ligase HUWE1